MTHSFLLSVSTGNGSSSECNGPDNKSQANGEAKIGEPLTAQGWLRIQGVVQSAMKAPADEIFDFFCERRERRRKLAYARRLLMAMLVAWFLLKARLG